jgi:hypothetical protein
MEKWGLEPQCGFLLTPEPTTALQPNHVPLMIGLVGIIFLQIFMIS